MWQTHYITPQQKLGKFSTCIHLHLNENYMKQNWKSQLQEPATLEYSPLDRPPKLLAQVKETS